MQKVTHRMGDVGRCAQRCVALAVAAVVVMTAMPLYAQVGFNYTRLTQDRQLGAARHWGAGMSVTPYSELNLETGRVLTTLPVVAWNGRGPAVSFALFHNAPATVSYLGDGTPTARLLGDTTYDGWVNPADTTSFIKIYTDLSPTLEEIALIDFSDNLEIDGGDVDGFVRLIQILPTGEGLWSHSYSRHLEFYPSLGKIAVVWDDGGKDYFTISSTINGVTHYAAPAGVFCDLTVEKDANNTPIGYMLTHKSQVKNHFHADGTLDYVADASVDYDDGVIQIQNRVICTYYDAPSDPWDGKLHKVTDAAGREITLTYNQNAKLKTITDPLPGIEQRTWTLWRETETTPDPEGNGRFVWFELPPEADQEENPEPNGDTIRMSYNLTGQMTEIRDLNDEPYTIAYSLGRVASVTNPLSQTVSFAYDAVDVPGWMVQQRETTYTDVRQNDWVLEFDEIGNLISVTDPLGHENTAAYADVRAQLAHQVTSVTNALSKTWTTTYDDAGNVLSTTDPLSHTTSYTYSPDGLNNLLTVTPAGITAKMVQYVYADTSHPKSPTSVILPADGQGNSAATIAMTYYGEEEPNAYGQLKSVVDANGVETLYEYNRHGTQWRVSEGDPTALMSARTCRAGLYNELGLLVGDLGSYTGERLELGSAAANGGTPRACHVVASNHHNEKEETESSSCYECVGVYAPCVNCPATTATPRSNAYSWGFPCPTAYGIGASGDFVGPSEFTYDAMSNMLSASLTADDATTDEVITRLLTAVYDALGRPTSIELETSEPNSLPYTYPAILVTRTFAYTYSDATGVVERLGPDGQTTRTELDAAGRVWRIQRGADLSDPTSPRLSVEYTYYDNDQIMAATYGNGARVAYLYDDAGRLDRTIHEWAATNEIILELDYTLSDDGLITQVAELGPNGWAANVVYSYDNRNQLIAEQRTGTHPYSLTYAYDQMGNRTEKEDVLNSILTSYDYDTDPNANYGTKNNRLMSYDVTDSTGWVKSVYYEYGDSGNHDGHVTRIVHETPAEDGVSYEYRSEEFVYNKIGELRLVSQHHWDSGTEWCDQVILDRIDEFRGSGRARYLSRQRDLVQDFNGHHHPILETAVWSDYDGDTIYGDYTYDFVLNTVVELAAYLPGVGRMDGATGEVVYFHADQVGSLRATSGDTVNDIGMVVYTAFGEEVHADGTVGERYRYAGAYGYQANEGFPYIHVGYRYYDPSTGRFLQRDPLGIAGGLNLYVYANNSPTGHVDPLGLWDWDWNTAKLVFGWVSLFVQNTATAVVGAAILGNETAQYIDEDTGVIDGTAHLIWVICVRPEPPEPWSVNEWYRRNIRRGDFTYDDAPFPDGWDVLNDWNRTKSTAPTPLPRPGKSIWQVP